ncbi:BNR-4 repeat-containing protein [Carboxylicivirga sp. A043]|uniref:BNR repeat-containing protein n=1 Tax=Carboxylicivirga litoralis TaxID=2816963 RepID=UPI0021CB1694|nr:BNR repeat-containing protein [Carboxylicivirga sp. A043]MCU4157736.1 BNR-4 repeat-containing protein [Carboxylicivirga sp. A043]
MKSLIFTACIFLVLTTMNGQEKEIKTLTSDGAWCWFSSPRAIYRHNGKPEIVTGWITKDGALEAGLLNLKNKTSQTQTITPKLEKDDHANPAFTELSDKDVLMVYTKHYDHKVRINRLSVDETKLNFSETKEHDIYDEAELKKYPYKRVTYANPFMLSKENNRIYCFGRWTGYKPNITWSDDAGESFVKSKVFITNIPYDGNNRPYVLYYSDGKSKIHILFTDGHPRNEPTNSVYYACYEKGAFWRADATKICDMNNIPFEPKDATVIYQADEENGRAWIYDIGTNKRGHPVVLYARYPYESSHLYHYAVYNGQKWIDNQICDAGGWFPQTPEGKKEPEPHYSAGMSLNPVKTNTVYLSRKINGVFEIEKRTTHDNGLTWDIEAITENSEFDNVRPVVPKNMKRRDTPVVLWMTNKKYIHYTNYETQINYLIDK